MKKKFGDVFKNTFIFCLLKLALGGIITGAALILFVILFGIGASIGDDVAGVFLLVWIVVACAALITAHHYIGYILKAGHVAAAADYIRTDMIPDRAYPYAVLRVRKRFKTAGEYYNTSRLVRETNRQLISFIEKSGAFENAKGQPSAIRSFIDLPLAYIDSCCIGYVFHNDRSNTHKSAAEGVAVFYTNWKRLLRNATFVTLAVIIGTLLLAALTFIISFMIFKAITPTAPYAAVIALVFMLLFTYALKFAFLDSFLTILAFTGYSHCFHDMRFSFDLYGKLCGYSRAFKELFTLGKRNEGYTMQSIPIPEHLRSADGQVRQQYNNIQSGYEDEEPLEDEQEQQEYAEPPVQPQPNREVKPKSVFCGECGAKNPLGTKFCTSCGHKL